MKKTNTFFAIRQFWTAFLVATGLLLFLGSGNALMGQAIVATQDFSSSTGFTTTKAYCNDTSCGSSDNTFGFYSGGTTCISGLTANSFYFRDIDACGSGAAATLTLPAMPIGTNSAELLFDGLFGFDNGGINYSGTNTVSLEYSFNGAPFTTAISFSTTGAGSMSYSGLAGAGNVAPDAANQLSFSLGNGHQGQNLVFQIVVNGFNGGTENFFMDSFNVSALCGIAFGDAISQCNGGSLYDVTIPYTGSESASVTATSTGASGVLSFDATVADGNIVLNNVNDVDDWNIEITGGSCITTLSGAAIRCEECPNTPTPTGNIITISTCLTAASYADQTTAANADPLNATFVTWADAVAAAITLEGAGTNVDAIVFETGYYTDFLSNSNDMGATLPPSLNGMNVFGNGSVLYLDNSASQVTFATMGVGVDDITFWDLQLDNYASTTGGISYMNDVQNVVWNNCIFNHSDRLAAAEGDAVNITNSAGVASDVRFNCCVFSNNNKEDNTFSAMEIDGDENLFVDFIGTSWYCNRRTFGGGALRVQDHPNIFMQGGTFTDNATTGSSGVGGAIDMIDGVLTIDGTTFIDNVSINNAGETGGGAISMQGGILTIRNALFSSNEATQNNAGAVCMTGQNTHYLSVDNTTFVGNSAAADAGAIFTGDEESTRITNCIFDSNTSGAQGGALYIKSGAGATRNKTVFYMSGTTISNNSGGDALYLYNVETSPESGAALGDEVTILNSTMCGNLGTYDYNIFQDNIGGLPPTYISFETTDFQGVNIIGNGAATGHLAIDYDMGTCPVIVAIPVTNAGPCPEAPDATASCVEVACDDCFTDSCNSSQQTDTEWATILAASGIGTLTASDCNTLTTATTEVEVANFAFTPNNPTVTLGDQVDFNWTSGTHNVNFIDNGNTGSTTDAWDSGATTNTVGINHSIIADMAGAFAFQCDPHSGGMTAILTVEPLIFCSEFTLAAADLPMYFTADAEFEFTGTCDPTATHSIQQENSDGITCDTVTPLYDNANNTGNNTTNPVYYMTTAGTYTHCISISALGDASCAISNVCPARITSCGSCDLATCNNDYQIGYDEFNPATPSATSLQTDNACNTITPILTTAGDQTTICTTYSPATDEGGHTGIGTSFSSVCDGEITLSTVVSNNTDNSNCNDITTTISDDNGFPVYDLTEGSTYEICVTATLTANCDLSELCIAPYGFASISGTAFYDDESTGDIQGDGTIDNVVVTLFDSSGNQIGLPIMTDANGDYTFDNLPNGNYYVTFTTPAGYAITTVNPNPFSTTDPNNSDIDATGTTPTFTLNDVDINDIDAAYVNGSLAGTVFTDTDGNGLDNDAVDVSGVSVQLFTSAGVQVTADADGTTFGTAGTIMTDASGNYLFDNLPFGNYYVEFTNLPTNNVLTTQDANSNGNDVIDSDAATTNGQTGIYILNAAMPNIIDVDAGVFVPASIAGTTYSDTNSQDNLSTGEPIIASVPVALYTSTGVQVTTDIDGNPLPTMTDASGNYLFDNLPLGDYYVAFTTPVGSTIATQDAGADDAIDSDIDTNGQTTTITLTSGLDVIDVDAIYPPQAATIGDFAFIDLDNDGIFNNNDVPMAGVTVELYDATTDTAIPAYSGANAQVTDGTGAYSFTGVPASTGDGYYVVFTTPAAYVVTAVGTGNNQNNITGTTGTGSTNDFTFDGLTNNLTVDAGFVGTGSIGDYVWEDTNGDGLQDEVGTGIDGVTITLTWFGLDGVAGGGDDVVYPTQDTAGGGAYNFTGLPMGSFSVAITANTPSGSLTASPPAIIILTDAAPIVDTADFGYQPACNANTGTFSNN